MTGVEGSGDRPDGIDFTVSILLTQGTGYCGLAVNFSYFLHYISLAS